MIGMWWLVAILSHVRTSRLLVIIKSQAVLCLYPHEGKMPFRFLFLSVCCFCAFEHCSVGSIYPPVVGFYYEQQFNRSMVTCDASFKVSQSCSQRHPCDDHHCRQLCSHNEYCWYAFSSEKGWCDLFHEVRCWYFACHVLHQPHICGHGSSTRNIVDWRIVY